MSKVEGGPKQESLSWLVGDTGLGGGHRDWVGVSVGGEGV